MNIIEVIKDLPDEQKLKVGAASGYFYVGTVGQFIRNIRRIEDKCRTFNQKKLKTKLKAYVPISQRNVKDYGMCLPSADKDVFRVVIDGNEGGLYWTMDEIMFLGFVNQGGAER